MVAELDDDEDGMSLEELRELRHFLAMSVPLVAKMTMAPELRERHEALKSALPKAVRAFDCAIADLEEEIEDAESEAADADAAKEPQ